MERGPGLSCVKTKQTFQPVIQIRKEKRLIIAKQKYLGQCFLQLFIVQRYTKGTSEKNWDRLLKLQGVYFCLELHVERKRGNK